MNKYAPKRGNAEPERDKEREERMRGEENKRLKFNSARPKWSSKNPIGPIWAPRNPPNTFQRAATDKATISRTRRLDRAETQKDENGQVKRADTQLAINV